ncbi:MAG: serine hydrolase [Cyclobacteriaceae bacterium]|nr:serine hydrolase [Cyclobacteriaceae bacterium]
MKKIFILFLLYLSITAQSQNPAQQVKEFDAYVESSRKLYQVPGLAITVVKDGKVIFKKGYGVQQLGRTNQVDTQTLYACASTTKAMTATCMGILVDEGKVKWDDPVIKYLPEFQLFDPYVSRELTIRDLFTHNSGVGNADFLWTTMNISSDEILAKMKMVEPSYSLRSSFIYQNIFYLAAGKVIEKVSGTPWEVFIQKNIFEPLSMTRTFPLLSQVKDVNQSHPHYSMNGKITLIERTSADAIGPAGSVWSCADDMSTWALCMLDSSKYKGGRLLKGTTWNELFKPQVMVTANQFYPTAQLTKPNWTTYGLGWFQQDYKGKKVNFHTGSLAGETAIHGQLPSEKLAIYIFGNLDHAEVRHALMFKAFDHFALGGTRDWSTDFYNLYKKLSEDSEREKKKQEAARVTGTNPSQSVTNYAGTYTSPLYGELVVTLQDNSLLISMNSTAKATLDHWNYDSFKGYYEKRWWGQAIANFAIDSKGKISSVVIEGMKFTR